MNPRLVAVSGPMAGRSFTLDARPVRLGRDYANDLHLRDLGVSRQHCVIEPQDEGFSVRDLGSLHGTFVNGVAVREHRLAHGDFLTVGDSAFLFQTEEPEDTGSMEVEEVQLDSWTWSADTTVERPASSSFYLRPDELLAKLSPDERVAQNLHALLRIGTSLSSFRATEPLARQLLEMTLETIPGERAALMLLARGSHEVASAWSLDRKGSTEPFSISRTLVERVVSGQSAVLLNDVLRTPAFGEAESLRMAHIQSLLAVALTGSEGALGVLYLDTHKLGVRFAEDHLELLTAVAGIAGPALANARHLEWLEEERRRLESDRDVGMVGESSQIKEVCRLLQRVAATDATVLLRGESGTGKEVAARAVHQSSSRAGKPFVAVNCAALSENLLESELFGHEKGAFTGAIGKKVGKFEAAHCGTLFLDEVGELPLPLQAKLLRALEEREIERVGGTRPVKVDVRVLAATNRDLDQALREGTFRDDLFYRLNVVAITLPPLRDRRDDVAPLASHFRILFSKKLGRRVVGFTAEARAGLLRYDWPGNVRELANAVERALVLGDGDLIRLEDLPETVSEAATLPSAKPSGAYHAAVNACKRQLIEEALAACQGNVTRAAERLALNPTYLHRLLSNLGLR